MESMKIFAKGKKIDWEYDEEGEVLSLSIGKPKKATGMDIGLPSSASDQKLLACAVASWSRSRLRMAWKQLTYDYRITESITSLALTQALY